MLTLMVSPAGTEPTRTRTENKAALRIVWATLRAEGTFNIKSHFTQTVLPCLVCPQTPQQLASVISDGCGGIESACSCFPSLQQGSCCWISSPPSKLKHCRGSLWPWEMNMGGLALLWRSPMEATSPLIPGETMHHRLLRWNSNTGVNQTPPVWWQRLEYHADFI